MHNSKIKRISLAVCLALMPFAAGAAGLGKLTVFSGLGEPLNAEIELTASKDELSALTARIAPAEIYAEQGLERPASLGILRLELGKQPSGAAVIKLTSVQPLNDPFLDMLIQVEWSSGRLLREYTALLDPPGFGDQKASVAAVTAPVTPSSSTDASTKSAQKSTPSKKTTAATQPAKAESAKSAAGAEGVYTTKPGDTLRSVARQTQVEGYSLEQMLVGLYQANKDAFIAGNMNRMKAGQIMHAPTSEQLQSLSQQQALQEIRIHTSDWNAYRNQLAGEVAKSAPADEAGKSQSNSGKITSAAEEKAAAAQTGPRDVVKLSKGDSVASKSGTAETPASKQDKINAAKDDEIAREKASREAEQKVATLEKQVQDMQKLLQLKNQSLTDLQQKGAATPASPPVPPSVPAEAKPAEPQQPAATAPVKPAEPVTAAATPATPAAEPPKPETPKKPRKHKPAPVVEPEPASPDILDDPMMMGGIGGGLLALLGMGWLFLRNKRRRSLDSFEKGILTTSGLKPNTVFGNSTGGMVDTGDTSFLTDLAHGGLGMIDTNDVDPIAEAEVYMAYGRDVQAEEILKDAIVKDPKRFELHQKLLEIYSNRKDTSAFETLAGELYATLGAADPMWQKFAEMGRAIEPSNPLYQADGLSSTALIQGKGGEASAPATVFDTPAPGEVMVTNFPPEANKTADDHADAQLQVPADKDDNSLDFLSSLDDATAAPTETGKESEPLPLDMQHTILEPNIGNLDAEPALDFTLELPEPAKAENVVLDAADLGLEAEAESKADESPVLESLPELEVAAAEPETASVEEEVAFELPEATSAELVDEIEPAGEVAAEHLEPTFDIPEVAQEESLAASESAEAPVDLEEISDVTFDMPEEIPLDQPDSSAAAVEDIPLELPSLEFEDEAADVNDLAPVQSDATSGANVEEIVLDAAPKDENALDFNFDVDVDETPEDVSTDDTPVPSGLPDLNLSGISLDLGEPESTETAPVDASQVFLDTGVAEGVGEVEEITLAETESSDVDTKLDLVSAYMDMGDTEGARELLEEVLREGGPMQRERAQGLLNSLG